MNSCLSSNCTSAEQAAATQQANQECAFSPFVPPLFNKKFNSLFFTHLLIVTAAGVQSTINNPTPTSAAIGRMNELGEGVILGAVVAMVGAAVGVGLTL